MSAAVGKDIESICGKCGDVWHVVVAMVGDKVAKVQCKQCSGYHRHRPPGSTKAPKRRSASTRRTAASAPKSHEPLIAADMSREIKAYRFDGDYEPGDRVEHPKFGTGIIEVTSEPGKMQVFFSDGRRVLARAKPASSLERPKPFVHRSNAEAADPE
ncbi:hypothetical protein [Haliangium ochraceum]|uniref:Uncharacterized protein n=1 Tax=Haliangium ochraceum (strain DSM 14365 / JCM 11303 / SMP-2) TaxID=502025 RepID=D0LXY9_HALO1|nr:hypothetical protein [Haliangium ochraceum]ACY14344.1 conserved hypothetical protein [Haliangium ochraceum DSM 14365]